MRKTVQFSVVLLLVLFLSLPVMAAGEEKAAATHTTEPAIIHGVTRDVTTTAPTTEPTPVPTRPVTAVPTKEPTQEPTKQPTAVPTTPATKATTPAPVIPQTGWVTIISTPAGAMVTVDGVTKGTTPVAAVELSSGTEHTVKISLAGYKPYETSVQLTPLEHTSVDATLVFIPIPEPTKTPAPAPTAPAQPIGAGKGWIRVNCNVDGATVSFNDHSAGCTVAGGSCSTEVGTAVTPFRTFTVQKPGYEIYTGQVTSWPKEGETIDFYATLNPLPAYGTIVVLTTPDNAVVTLDGTTERYSPATFSSVTAGSHTIQVITGNYQPYITTVWVDNGMTSTVNAVLVPVNPQPSTGSVSVSSIPSGADIYVDGRYTAYTPATIPGLAPGTHTIRLQKAGYDEFLTTIRIVAGQTIPLSVPMASLPPTVGSIEVTSVPAGATIYLDGTYMGQTQPNDYFDITSLVQGTHTVTLRLADYQDYTHTVFVTDGKVVTITAPMTPVVPGPVADTTGQIAVVSVPPGANLYLDNTFRGITPVTLNDIQQGSHIITLSQPGYADAVRTISVTGGQVTPVSMSLAEATPTPVRKSPSGIMPVFAALALAGMACVMRRA